MVYLASEAALAENDKTLPTATVVRIEMPADWQHLTAGCGRFISLTRPRSLPD
jgi:phosphohistidine phosphatase